MENDFKERKGFSGAVATTLNYTGMGLVYAYDATAITLKGIVKLAKKTTKIKNLFSTNAVGKRLDEYQHIQHRIDQYENRIKSLYFEIGKLGAQNADTQNPVENEDIKKLLDDVKEYEKEIKRLDSRLADIRGRQEVFERPQHVEGQSTTEMANEHEHYEESLSHLKSVIDKGIRHEKFESQSEREIFTKVANDLLDTDPEIQVLAAAELAKMDHPGAIPILIAASKLNQPELTNEIINALIIFDDERAVQVFKEEMANPRFSVRIGCLRGIYKLGDDHDVVSILSDALRDKHSEVRRTAATFLGWRDKSDAIPALVQCLKDENERVRRATVDALSNIKDPASVLPLIKVLADEKLDIRERAYGAIRLITSEKIEFDLHLTGSKLKEEIIKLRDWWQEFRMEKKKTELAAEDLDEAEDILDPYEPDDDIHVTDKLDTGESSESSDAPEISVDMADSQDMKTDETEETEETDEAETTDEPEKEQAIEDEVEKEETELAADDSDPGEEKVDSDESDETDQGETDQNETDQDETDQIDEISDANDTVEQDVESQDSAETQDEDTNADSVEQDTEKETDSEGDEEPQSEETASDESNEENTSEETSTDKSEEENPGVNEVDEKDMN